MEWAAGQGVLSPEQAAELWKRLEERHAQQPHFSADHVAYYFGAMIVISAMGWFMTLAWETLGGLGIAGIPDLKGRSIGVLVSRPGGEANGRVLDAVLTQYDARAGTRKVTLLAEDLPEALAERRIDALLA
ncbi:MAG: hypothetical protein EB034_21180, partial [Verrucomicrobia bacterium]|nr:hypothetical protein [Verrucomicrobiota bacterium]